MNERVVEILIYIMNELRRDRKYSQKLDLLSKNLIQEGYTESEISSALTWLLDRVNFDSEELVERESPALKHSFRHLHEIEKSIISAEAYGYIIQLKELHILESLDVEEVLERALMLGTSAVGIDAIRSIVVSVLFRNGEFAEGTYLLLEENSIIQ